MKDSAVAYRARFVFPPGGKPIPGGVVTLRGKEVLAAGTSADFATIDLGNVAIIPGLVNAHTHLEFSDLEQPLGHAGQSIPDWIREVIAFRRSETRNRRTAIQVGLDESCAAGVTQIGEIATDGWQSVSPSAEVTLFQESICLDRQRFKEVHAVQTNHLNDRRAGFRPGISPHAPYTVHPQLVHELVDLAVQYQVPVAMHLAESREELELLRSGTGPFRTFLESMGVWKDDANPQGMSPLDYLQILSRAPRALVVHGNYLQDAELGFLAEHKDHMSVVYCPRTHAYFQHAPYPLAEMLARGISVCLGTDSRASNPDLSVFEEARFVAAKHTSVSPQQVLQMVTLAGLRALIGGSSSSAAWRTGFTVVVLPEENFADPFELLFADGSQVADPGRLREMRP